MAIAFRRTDTHEFYGSITFGVERRKVVEGIERRLAKLAPRMLDPGSEVMVVREDTSARIRNTFNAYWRSLVRQEQENRENNSV
jgi:hypothetical protein